MSNNWTIENGWLSHCKHLHSPFYNERPQACAIDLLVVHGISVPLRHFGSGNISALFLGCLDADDPVLQDYASDVASHLLVDREGHVTQFVSFEKRAWHAGVSEFQGRTDCNDFSIGIELEGADDIRYTEMQYEVLNQLIIVLKKHYPLQHIAGHDAIAPNRKTDPGPAFDWSQVKF